MISVLKPLAVTLALSGLVKPATAYDMDCAIMLCMAGGFPPSAVCAAAYAEMIRRITPWPSQPPFGICTYASVPVALGGPGGEGGLDISTPDYAWLRRTRILWWAGRYADSRDGSRWTWSLTSCNSDNRSCQMISRGMGSETPWPENFVTENGQIIDNPAPGLVWSIGHRAVMMEYSDYEGVMDHSEWFRY